MKPSIGITLALLLSVGCTNENGARHALDEMHYRDVRLTDAPPNGCKTDDDTCAGFVATGPTGATVTGTVGCSYVFKGCAVRVAR